MASGRGGLRPPSYQVKLTAGLSPRGARSVLQGHRRPLSIPRPFPATSQFFALRAVSFVPGRQGHTIGGAMDGQSQHHRRGDLTEAMRRCLVEMGRGACRTDVIDIRGNESEKGIARAQRQNHRPPQPARRLGSFQSAWWHIDSFGYSLINSFQIPVSTERFSIRGIGCARAVFSTSKLGTCLRLTWSRDTLALIIFALIVCCWRTGSFRPGEAARYTC